MTPITRRSTRASARAAALLLAALLAASSLSALTGCKKRGGGPISIDPGANAAVGGTAPADAQSAGNGDEAASPEGTYAPAVSGQPDADADTVEGIAIKTAADLQRIGKSDAYPLDGDYVLAADIDMSILTSFVPIGGAESESGIVSGSNVFSGTFDGRGHTISGLKLAVTSQKRVHVGLFGSVGSDDKDDRAVIKNLILKDVSVRGNANGVACYAVLCGQVSGYVDIDNIAVMSGSVSVENKNGDILGIGALIGQCRTDTNTGVTNKPIHITNIFTNIPVTGSNNGHNNYTSGLIGRIRGGDIGLLKNIVQLGTVTHEGTVGGGNAISSGDAGAKSAQNVYYLAGCGTDGRELGQAKSFESLTGGNLKLDGDLWHVEEGMTPMPEILYNSPLFSVVDFVTLTLAEGERADKVESDFPLTASIMGKPITWFSDKPAVIRIDGNTARVTKPEFGFETVKLTARADGILKDFTVNVVSGVTGSLVLEGNTIRAERYPEGLTFKWIVKDLSTNKTVDTVSTKDRTYTLTDPEKQVLVNLQAEGFDTVSLLVSKLPTVYITSESGYYDVSKSGYSTASMKIEGAGAFPGTAYDGGIGIKLRGNSTAYASKRPFKIKLDEKADIFGMGANKHWCLLANHYDRTNLRNKVSYDFSMDLGLEGCSSEMVNVVYNGDYYGLYELTEAIRVGETRVNIFDWEELAEDAAKAIAKKEDLDKKERNTLEAGMVKDLSWITTGVYKEYSVGDYIDLSGLDITGGYLIEDDAYYDEATKFTTKNDMKLMLKKPEFLASNKEMMNYLKDYVQNAEDAIYAPNRLSGEGLHYSDYMDVPSFVDFWVVNALYKNVELLFKSCYLYKPVGGKLTWGPVWDMDWTSANHVNLDPTSAAYDSWKQGQSQDREYWYKALYNDPWFIVQLCERWNSIGDKVDAMFAHYDELAEDIRPAAEADNKLWRYDWTYQKEIDTLREWLMNRRAWMDEQMRDPAVMIDSLGYYKKSDKIALSEPVEKDGEWELTLKVTDGDGKIASADVLVNGRILFSDIEAKDGAVIRIPKDGLRDAGLCNSVEVLAKDANGKYLAIRTRSGQDGSNANEGAWAFIVSR